MKICADPCPKYGVNRCCFQCEERKDCNDSCVRETPDGCANLKDDIPMIAEKQAEPMMKELREIVQQKKALEEKEKALKDKLKVLMEDTDSKAFKNNPFLSVTYVAAATSTSIDSAALKKKYPAVYAECSKTAQKSSYIKVEVKE